MPPSTPSSLALSLARHSISLRPSLALPAAAARRRVHIHHATAVQAQASSPTTAPFPTNTSDARFNILGFPFSLLSVDLGASQNLYTRRGTLLALNGKPENVISTLRLLEPFRRALLRIPFLYQKISTTTPVTALISVRSPVTSFAVVELDGSLDWMVAQRDALLAWSGHSIKINPVLNASLTLAHWGQSAVFGRGSLALVGRGQIYSVDVKPGEKYVVHPSNVVAYTMTSKPPAPFRFRSTSLNLQIPLIPRSDWLSRIEFLQKSRHSKPWTSVVSLSHHLRTWMRRTIWGDRLFLQFEGPTRLLIQSRASTVNEVLSTRQVNEIADAPPGAVEASLDSRPTSTTVEDPNAVRSP